MVEKLRLQATKIEMFDPHDVCRNCHNHCCDHGPSGKYLRLYGLHPVSKIPHEIQSSNWQKCPARHKEDDEGTYRKESLSKVQIPLEYLLEHDLLKH